MPQITRPIAVPGGVMLIPLNRRRPGNDWPEQLEIKLETNQSLSGELIWIEPQSPAASRRWTDDPRRLRVQEIESSEKKEDGVAHVIFDLPRRYSGEITIAGRTVRPTWITPPPQTDPENPPALQLPRIASPERPDPDSPFEYWRWVLLAERLDRLPPEPPGTKIEQMVARHDAQLWQAGLARLEQVSPGVAHACIDLLTAICESESGPIAAWICDPRVTGELLSLLLDPKLQGKTLSRRALTWADGQNPLIIWPDSLAGQQVRIAVANPTVEPAIVHVQWLIEDEIPLAMETPPLTVRSFAIDRPLLPERPEVYGRTFPVDDSAILAVVDEGIQRNIAVGPRVAVARPPGVNPGPFSPRLTLAEARAGTQRAIAAKRNTTALLRRVNRKWEIYIQANRPGGAGDGQSTGNRKEAIALRLGPAESPDIQLIVPEQGNHRFLIGADAEGLQLHRRSYDNHWRCRLVLPDDWLPLGDATLKISLVRTHGDSRGIETTGGPMTPWRPVPSVQAINLFWWGDLPKP